MFKNITSFTNEFTNCFQNKLPLQKQIENWKSTLKKHIGRAFTKVRIRNKPKIKKVPENIHKYIDLRNQLVNHEERAKKLNCNQSGMNERLMKNNIETAISDIEARHNYEKIIKN